MISVEWETPQEFFDELNKEFKFVLDPCASRENRKCNFYFSKEFNGLSKSWTEYKSIFMNPPHTKEIGKWLKKAYETSQLGSTIVCLIQGRSSDTKWWHDYVMKASEIRYIKDRLHFGINKTFNRANISSIVVVFRSYCQGPPKICSINTKGKRRIDNA